MGFHLKGQIRTTSMFLYNLTLQRATAITASCHGNFSGHKQQEIAVAKGKILEILKPDPNTGKVHTVYATDVFGVIRSLAGFRLTGGSKDYLIVGELKNLNYFDTINLFRTCMCRNRGVVLT